MPAETNSYFISGDELAERLGQQNISILDASWYLPAMNRDGRAEFDKARIPGARYFDINAIANLETDLPHMLPKPEVFAAAVSEMGVSETDDIIVYDGPGVFSSARLWWTFRVMGAKKVRILAGGMDGWKASGKPVDTGTPPPPTPSTFTPQFDVQSVRDATYMLGNIRRGETLVLDARPFGRFTGEVPEPREGLRRGHIPGSRSLPAMDIVRDGQLLPKDQLADILEVSGVKPGIHVTTTCGSGVTAAILSLALETIGHEGHSLYDGSWADWGRLQNVPVARWE